VCMHWVYTDGVYMYRQCVCVQIMCVCVENVFVQGSRMCTDDVYMDIVRVDSVYMYG
jgi:hypothetical protein